MTLVHAHHGEMSLASYSSAPPPSPLPPPPPDGNINTADPEWEAPFLSDLEVVYLTWDVLYLDGRCVCHLPLLERRELLRRVVRDAPPEGAWCGWLAGWLRG